MLGKVGLTLSMLFILSACGSSPKAPETTEFAQDQVVGRSDDKSARPDWASETISVKDKGAKIEFVGVAEVPGDSRAQAAFKMSDAAARGNIANKIETSVLKTVQVSDTGLNMEDQSLKSLISEVSHISLRNVDVKDRYWEKAVRTSSAGQKTLVMKSFSLIEVDKAEVQKMMLEKTQKSTAAAPDVKNKVEALLRDQWAQSGFTE